MSQSKGSVRQALYDKYIEASFETVPNISPQMWRDTLGTVMLPWGHRFMGASRRGALDSGGAIFSTLDTISARAVFRVTRGWWSDRNTLRIFL